MTIRRFIVAATSSLLLHACGGSDAPSVITVAGTVINSQGAPAPSVNVAIGTSNTLSDATGHFSITNVQTPYDVTLTATGQTLGVVYKGLTRTDPHVIWVGTSTGNVNSGTIAGNLSGGDGLPAAADRTSIAFGSPEGSGSDLVTVNPFSLEIEWLGTSATTTGTLHALQWTPASSAIPTAYKGYGSRGNVAVVNLGTTNGQDVAMTVPTASTVGGAIVVPAGYTLGTKSLSVEFPDQAAIQVGSESTAATAFSYPFPSGIGATAAIVASATGAAGSQSVVRQSGITAGTTSASITLPTVPSFSAPANNATGVNTATDFTWTATPNTVSIFVFQGSGSAPTYYIFGAGTTSKIPNLAAQGVPLPAATPYQVLILALGPFSSIDALAGQSALILPTGTVTEAISAPLTVTTQ